MKNLECFLNPLPSSVTRLHQPPILKYEPVVITFGPKNKQQAKLVESYFERRHAIYAVKLGWTPKSPDGLSQDDHDRHGHCDYVLLASNDGQVGTGCRLVWSSLTAPLPIQKYLDDPTSVPTDSVEVSALVTSPQTAKRASEFLGFLLGYLLEECTVSGVYVMLPQQLLAAYARRGFHCYERLAGSPLVETYRDGNKEFFVPVWVDLAEYQKMLQIVSRFCS